MANLRRTAEFVPIAVFLAAVAILIKGIIDHDILDGPAWTRAGAVRFGYLSGAYWVVSGLVIVGIRRLHFPLLVISLLGVASVNGIAPLASVGITLYSAWLLGGRLLRALGEGVHETRILALALGLGVMVLVVYLLGQLDLMNFTVVCALVFTPVAMNARQLARQIQHWIGTVRTGGVEPDFRSAACLAAFGYVALIYVTTAMLPETGHDALAMHLVIADYVARHGGWDFEFTRLVWATMPMNGDWAYAFVYLLGGEFAARLLNVALIGLVAWMLHSVMRKWLSGPVSNLAVLVFTLMPLMYLLGSWLFIESVLMVFVLSAVICLFLYGEHGRPTLLYLLATFAGLALSTKLMTALLLPALLVSVVWEMRARVSASEAIRLLLATGALFVSIGAYPYLEALYRTSNPVFPFFNAVFQSPFYARTENFADPRWQQSLRPGSLYDITFNSGAYLSAHAGAIGFQLLVLLPVGVLAVLLRRTRVGIHSLWLAMSYVVLLFQFAPNLRYFAAVVPLLILVCAFGLEWIRQRSASSWGIALTFLAMSWLLNVAYLPAAGGRSDFPVTTLIDRELRERFLHHSVPERAAVGYLNGLDSDDMVVGVFARPFMAGLKAPYFVASWYSYEFDRSSRAALGGGSLLPLVERYGLTHLVVGGKPRYEPYHALALDIADPVHRIGPLTVYATRER